jgi:hypothetical protein
MRIIEYEAGVMTVYSSCFAIVYCRGVGNSQNEQDRIRGSAYSDAYLLLWQIFVRSLASEFVWSSALHLMLTRIRTPSCWGELGGQVLLVGPSARRAAD